MDGDKIVSHYVDRKSVARDKIDSSMRPVTRKAGVTWQGIRYLGNMRLGTRIKALCDYVVRDSTGRQQVARDKIVRQYVARNKIGRGQERLDRSARGKIGR